MPAKFVVKKGTTGKFRFSLVAVNGEPIASSEAYNSKASAMNGIKAVRKAAADAEVEDQTTKAWEKAQAELKAAAAAKKAAASAKKAAAKKAPAKKAPAKKAAAGSGGAE